MKETKTKRERGWLRPALSCWKEMCKNASCTRHLCVEPSGLPPTRSKEQWRWRQGNLYFSCPAPFGSCASGSCTSFLSSSRCKASWDGRKPLVRPCAIRVITQLCGSPNLRANFGGTPQVCATVIFCNECNAAHKISPKTNPQRHRRQFAP